ncbi:MAG: divalent-cation tolerance protein CutA [Candidatus Rokubacteria bacterium]|nr:divalent-cation tolerance protein CutA [Candidatus Rokubacteria bacterium]
MSEVDTLVVLVTVPSIDAGTMLARALVEERLAACVNVVPGVRSIFFWEGRLQEESEALLVVKTGRDRYEALQRRILALHPYSVPEVLALPVESGFPAYVAWVRESVGTEGR